MEKISHAFKKRHLFVGILFFICLNVHAQRYDFLASSGVFTPLVGATDLDTIETNDLLSPEITFPDGFQFNYFGTNYTSFKASSNGFITFNTASSSSSNYNWSPIVKSIAPLWDDLGGTGGKASYKLSGTAPNRVFTFEWLNWKWYFTASAANISFQAHLHENGTIVFVYNQEAGNLSWPDASIAIIGNNTNQYYCLGSSLPTAAISPSWVYDISLKPASGQTYTFTPNPAAITAPATQASNVTATLGNNNANLSWTNGGGQFRAVFMKETSAIENVTPFNNQYYYSDAIFEYGEYISGWYCVYNGTGSNVNVAGLKSGFTYRVQVIEYNGVAALQQYNTNTATNNPVNITTVLSTPTGSISTIKLKHKSSAEISFNRIDGSGDNVAIFMKAGTTGTSLPLDNTTYTANSNFGSGAQIGTSGWYCVFNGSTSPDVTITGLSANTDYIIHAVDYNGSAGSERYNVSSETNNPVQVKTYIPTTSTYTFTASAGSFTPITGGTDLDVIETDDRLSSSIPIGFTFQFADNSFTELKVSSNGWLSFNLYEEDSYPGSDLSNTYGSPCPLLAPLWGDLGGQVGTASYKTAGTVPNRVFIMQFLNWKWNYRASAAGISFQVKLYETTGKIEYIYREEAGALNNPSASIGLSFPETGSGHFLSLSNASASPTISSTVETFNIATKPATGQIYTFVVKHDQAITFDPLPLKGVSAPDFDLAATSSSGLAVTYASSNTAVATISGSTVTIVGVGSTDITASQVGNEYYNAAIDVVQSLTVNNKTGQVITFEAIADKTLGDASFTPVASSSSSLAVSFSSSSDKVTISGNQITMVKAGSTTITANQSGNASYNPAVSVDRTFCINPSKPIISATGLETATAVLTSNALSGNQWYKNGTAIVGATNVTLNVTTLGTYTVTAQVDNCVSVPSNEVVKSEANGIDDENLASSVLVYPNPMVSKLTIELPNDKEATITIVNMTGETVKRVIGYKIIEVDVQNLASGYYIVLVYTKEGFISKKITKI